ncbi:MAG TPA: acetyltransferase [Allosphingosinicella sp.]|jgi:sugar O-acyltransferase (sialic acid O-acetyltransferase NeuD family)
MRLVIFGTGGMGREAADLARRSDAVRERYGSIAFAADDAAGPVDALPVLAPDEIGAEDEICLALGDPAERRRLARRFETHRFASLAAATAIVSPSARIGTGALLCDHSLVNAAATVGAHFQGNVFSHVSHDCVVGDFVTFAPRVSCNGWVEIGDDVFVGAGAVIRNGSRERPLRIGAGAVIGMGAIVVADVAPGSVVVSPPARPRG